MKLLVIAYFFPPLGGAGVQRTLKLIRHLPESGWESEVVTVKEPAYWIRDETLLGDIPAAVAVHRVSNPVPVGGAGEGRRRSTGRVRALRRIAGFVFLPDLYVLWSRMAAREGARRIRRGGIDAVWTTSSPDSAHLAGLRLQRDFGVPWIADFRDPWTRRMSFDPPTGLHGRLQARMEEKVVRHARRVVVTSEETREDFLARYPRLDPERVAVVTNGFDEEDFSGFRLELPRDVFRILHLGQLNPERSLLPLLEPLRDLLKDHPEATGRVEVVSIGPHYASHVEEARRLGLEEAVRFLPPCSHKDAIAWLGRAHLLLLLEKEGPRGRLILPGKIFEYLRSGRSILAIVDPGGGAARLVVETKAGWVFSPTSRDRIRQGLADRWKAFVAGRVDSGAKAGDLGAFERRGLARKVASILADAVTDASR